MRTINCTTGFIEKESAMIQNFANGYTLATDFKTGITGVVFDGDVKAKYHDLSIKEYMKLQIEVQDLKTI